MKNEKKRTLRGSILFTVVSVMAILIIFLIGTLTLASAANNRAHKSYSSSQASYTARSAIESFTEAMQKNEGIVAAVQNLSATNPVMYPEVVIDDTASLGVIGYYDTSGNFVRDHITVERVAGADSYTLYATDADGHAAIDADPVEQVRITATVRVGKEEETVSAIIRKRASGQTDSPDPPSVKGLQTVGDASFKSTAGFYSGAVTLGLKGDSDTQAFGIHNESEIAADQVFVNGTLEVAGNSLVVDINTPETSPVILGSLFTQNHVDFNINYGAYFGSTNFDSVKDIPYLYVDGLLKTNDSVEFYVGKKGDKNSGYAPFNVYAGTLDMQKGYINADIYMLDEATGEETPYIDENKNIKGYYYKGKNKLGNSSSDGTKLYKWSTSLYTGVSLDSYGGNVYCNGDLDLGAAVIEGDVRVAGDCTLTSSANDTYIYGNLIVGENLSVTNKDKLHVSGNVYCDGAVSGWGEPSSDLLPGVSQVPNFEHVVEAGCTDYFEYPLTSYMPDRSGYMGYFGENAGWNSPVYYRYSNIERDASGNIINYELDSSVAPLKPWDSKTAYDVVNWTQGALQDDGTAVDSGNPLDHPEDGEFSYYKNGSWIPASQAYGAEGISPTSAIVTSVYPTNMTREAIYGSYDASGEFQKAPSATKIVTTLDEMQAAIGYDDTAGEFDASKYPTALPSAQQAVLADATKKAACTWHGQAVVNRTTMPEAYDNGILIFDASCKDEFDNFTMNRTGNLEIDAESGFVILFDSMRIGYNATNFNIVINEATGSNCNIYFKGENTLYGNTSITTRKILNATHNGNGGTVTEDDTVGLVYYAYPDAVLHLGNNSTMVGNALAPELTLTYNVQGKYENITYKDANGITLNTGSAFKRPHWIGNALVKAADGTNNFVLFYTKPDTSGGGGGGGGGGFETDLGYYELSYFSAA